MNQNHGPSPPVSRSQFHRFPLPTPCTYTTEKPSKIPPPKPQNLELIGNKLGNSISAILWRSRVQPVSWNLSPQGRNFPPVPVGQLPWLGGSRSLSYPLVVSCRVLAQKYRIMRDEPLLVTWPDLVFHLFLAGIARATWGSFVDPLLGNGAFWICSCHFRIEIC